jgi:polygalacturonase
MLKYLFLALPLFARAGDDYKASAFGIRSNGITLNTRSIQYAVDYIHARGGGRLVFEVGRYLTGTIQLKSNVGIELKEGAVLLGSLNPFDYDKHRFTALLLGDSLQNISITGKGVIDGQGRQVAANIVALVHSGVISDPLVQDRPNETLRPMLVYLRSCNNVTVKNVTLKDAASWVETYDQCSNVTIDSITVNSKAYWNNDGIDIVDCANTNITNCFIDAADDGICLKSHDPNALCTGIFIHNCTIRSSASAIKFGTASLGGFNNVHIIRNRVYDTYRSAIALEAVDGGAINNIFVDSLEAYNTGNAFFLRTGNRNGNGKSSLTNIYISNMHVDIAAGKADAGYEYEGPVEDQPRNICPIVMAGLPNQPLTGIYLNNVFVNFPGGGNNFIASRTLAELDSIAELPAKYPEFSMFKELPAWGLFIRHAQQVELKNVTFTCAAKDYRTAIVLDDVRGANFKATVIKEPGNKSQVYQHNTKDVKIE